MPHARIPGILLVHRGLMKPTTHACGFTQGKKQDRGRFERSRRGQLGEKTWRLHDQRDQEESARRQSARGGQNNRDHPPARERATGTDGEIALIPA